MKKDKSDKQAIQSVYRALREPVADVDTMDTNEVRAFLVEEGIDPAKLRASLSQRVKEVEGRLRLQRAGTQYRSTAQILGKMGASLASAVGDTKEAVMKRLEGLQARQPELAAAMFRKFEQADETDFKAIYEDLLRLDALNGNGPE